MNGKIFNPNIIGVGQRRDFYQMHTLTEKDLQFVRMMTIGNDKGLKREVHEMRIKAYIEASKLMSISETLGQQSKKLANLSRVIRSNFMEDAHCDIENQGEEGLNCLLKKDVSFLNDPQKIIDFSIYLITQWLRTEKMRNLQTGIASPIDKGTLERTWALISPI